MDIQLMSNRIFYLMGQLDEAKRIHNSAVEELTANANKEQAKPEPSQPA